MNTEQNSSRVYPRTSMFVLATMVADTVSAPIKIRNMSPGGALIEGDALPAVGEQVCLRRGDLTAAGKVVWRRAGKAGLRFEGDIQVTRWLPAGSGNQQLVDRMFAELKTTPTASPSPAVPQRERASISGQEVLQLADALDALADDLAGHTAVIAHHASKLQTLDIASQVLRKIAASMARGSSGDYRDLEVRAARAAHVA